MRVRGEICDSDQRGGEKREIRDSMEGLFVERRIHFVLTFVFSDVHIAPLIKNSFCLIILK